MSRRFLALLGATLAVGGALVVLLLWPEKAPARAAPPPPVVRAGPDNRVELSVTERGFEPLRVHVAAGVPVTLVVTRKTNQTCATELTVLDPPVNVPLPLDTPVTITFLPGKSGALVYGCAMGMMIGGVLLVD